MTAGALLAARKLASMPLWLDVRTVLDVGTAQGGLLVELLRAHPHLEATGLDLPPVRPYFEAYAAAADCVDRIAFRAGDFRTDAWPTRTQSF